MWYLNNGANNHVCCHKYKFMEIDESIRGNAIFLGNSKIVIKGKERAGNQKKNISEKYNFLLILNEEEERYKDYCKDVSTSLACQVLK